jgi:thiol-disulfide isomerase/thioredoxin
LNNLQSPFDDDLNNKGDSMFCDCKYAGFMKLDSLKSAQYGVQPIKRYHYIKRNDNTETIEISNTTVFPDRRRSMLWLVDNMQPINSGYAFLQKELTKITTKYTLVPSADFDDPNRVLPPPQLPGEKLLLDSVPITTLTTFDGAPYSLDKVRGKMILLDFWFINCQACAKTMPEIQKVYEKYNSNGLAVVGINPFDFDLDSVKSTMKKYGIEYPVYMDYTSELVTKLGILSYPTLILFDPGTKKISAFHVGSTDLSDFLKIVDDNFRKQ